MTPERTFLGHRLDWKQRADHFTAPSFLSAANAGLRKRLWLAVQAARRIETEPARQYKARAHFVKRGAAGRRAFTDRPSQPGRIAAGVFLLLTAHGHERRAPWSPP